VLFHGHLKKGKNFLKVSIEHSWVLKNLGQENGVGKRYKLSFLKTCGIPAPWHVGGSIKGNQLPPGGNHQSRKANVGERQSGLEKKAAIQLILSKPGTHAAGQNDHRFQGRPSAEKEQPQTKIKGPILDWSWEKGNTIYRHDVSAGRGTSSSSDGELRAA